MPTVKKNSPKPLQLVLPATSANLGPGFDAAALAFNLYLRVDARLARQFSIEATGRDADVCRELKDNLILTTYSDVLRSQRKEPQPLKLRIKNEAPIGKGCGSSASARLAGIALANHFGRLKWGDEQIIAEASRREHHPDNASACWLGGVTVSRMSSDSNKSGDGDRVQTLRVLPPGKWPLLLAVPEERLSTEKARAALPATYSRADAVVNIQNSMLLLAALMQGRRDLLASALEDRIHQPYRAALCPLLPALSELTGQRGVLGVALSGAGPSVLVFLDPKVSLAHCRKLVAAHLAKKGLWAELLNTAISSHGANRGG